LSRRVLYRQFVDEVIIKPGTRHLQSSRSDVTLDDHVRTAVGSCLSVITQSSHHLLAA